MAKPATYNLDAYANDDFSLALDFVDANGAALNKSTYTFSASVRKNRWDDVELAEFAVDTTDAATGRIVISLTNSQVTTALDKAAWDIQQTSGDATPVVRTLLQGTVYVDQDITRG